MGKGRIEAGGHPLVAKEPGGPSGMVQREPDLPFRRRSDHGFGALHLAKRHPRDPGPNPLRHGKGSFFRIMLLRKNGLLPTPVE